MAGSIQHLGAACALLFLGVVCGCEDELNFSTSRTEVFTGEVVDADFVLLRPDDTQLLAPGTTMDLSLHMTRLDTDPGMVSTSDGLLDGASLVALQAITFDRLSALEIPGGFMRSLVFLAPVSAPELRGTDAVLFVSLRQDGGVEARVLAGAGEARRVFGLFRLQRETIDDELSSD